MKPIVLPSELRGVFFEGRWENHSIWALPTPVSYMNTATLWWHLDLPIWSTVPGRPLFDLAPRSVIAAPGQYPVHWARIRAADIAFALDLFQNGERWVIVDGYHRLVRLFVANRTEAAVRLHPRDYFRRVCAAPV